MKHFLLFFICLYSLLIVWIGYFTYNYNLQSLAKLNHTTLFVSQGDFRSAVICIISGQLVFLLIGFIAVYNENYNLTKFFSLIITLITIISIGKSSIVFFGVFCTLSWWFTAMLNEVRTNRAFADLEVA